MFNSQTLHFLENTVGEIAKNKHISMTDIKRKQVKLL